MEQPKKPNVLAELMARDILGEQLSALRQKPQPQPQPHIPNSADKGLSPSTLKALARFGPGNASSIKPTSKPEPLPLPGTDWELWAHMPKATLTEAVAVSLGIDPSALKPRSGYAEPGKDFERRLKLACAFVSHAGPLKSLDTLPPNHLMDGPATATVSLPQFAAWALSMKWELPEKFPRFKAAPTKPATNSTVPATPATQNPLYVAIQHIVKSELQKHTPAPVVPIEPQAAPVVAVGASGGVEPDKAGPLPVEQGLLTKDIAACFGDCYYSADNWPKRLSGTAWLETARIERGEAGGASAVWNPLTLAQLMHRKTNGDKAKDKLMKTLNSRFTKNPALGPWRDAFNEYFATYCATE